MTFLDLSPGFKYILKYYNKNHIKLDFDEDSIADFYTNSSGFIFGIDMDCEETKIFISEDWGNFDKMLGIGMLDCISILVKY